MAHKVCKLANGLNLITVPVKGTKAVTVLVLLPIGSRYEHKKISGVSHFVEHMLFKGTVKRPTALDISRELEAVGADYNAFTGKEYAGYYVKIDGANQELAFDLLSDMVFNSKMDAKEMAKEKGVIVEELRMYEDTPSMFINLLFDRLLFGDCPLGWDEGGTKETVRALDREALKDYYKSAYEPANMVLAAAGNIDGKKINALARGYFVERRVGAAKEKRDKNSFSGFVWPQKGIGLADRIAAREKKLDQAHLILGFPGLAHNHPARYAAALMLYVLGGGMSSRLFVEVREKRGLAYMVHSGGMNFRDSGAVYARAGLDPARLPEALKVIQDELRKMADRGVTARELRDAKNNAVGRMALAMEESSAQAEWFAKQFWFMDKMETPDETVRKIKEVTAAEVRAIAKKLFDFDEMRLAVIGPVDKSEILKILSAKGGSASGGKY